MKYREREVYLHEFVTPIEVSSDFLSRKLNDKAPVPFHRRQTEPSRPHSL